MTWYDRDACGVGFIASLTGESSHENVLLGLRALVNLEHRGGTSADFQAGDGSGILTDIPHELLGSRPGDAVANLFLPADPTTRIRSLRIFEETFQSVGLEILRYREVPVDDGVLPEPLRGTRPGMLMAFIRRPEACTSRYTFEKMLYTAKQLSRSRLREAGILKQFFFTSLSAGTVVYKALLPAHKLAAFYPDLADARYRSRFALFHRRFSTNTAPAWDTVQPFRVVAHNGEINTISGNRAWAYARERALGLREDELLTHIGISDSGSVNEMVEALMYRSSIPHPEDILAILVPPPGNQSAYYRFWGRAMEAWDGPALFTYSDGRVVGARLDRNGFRPCRWMRTRDRFFLSSEAGSFEIPEEAVLAKGTLTGGGSARVDLRNGEFHFRDASRVRENRHASFDPRLTRLERLSPSAEYVPRPDAAEIFNYTEEDFQKVLAPLVGEGKEGIGSMGDTARLAAFSSETRSLFDYFYQSFAQVTNPPLDYLRERLVTDMTVVLGRRPNIFEPKELIPLKGGIELDGPVLTLGQMEFLKSLDRVSGFEGPWPGSVVFDMTFPRSGGAEGLRAKIAALKEAAAAAIRKRISLFILSDRRADHDNPPIPAVLLVSALSQDLQREGLRLRATLVVDSGQVKNPHHVAVLVAFGAAAVCPYVPLEIARFGHPELPADPAIGPEERELRVVRGLEGGLLKVMSKMGISVVRSYHASELFTILGLGEDLHREFFPRHPSPIGGLSLEALVGRILRDTSGEPLSRGRSVRGRLHNHLYKENPKEAVGERHSMTIARAKLVHRGRFDEYLEEGEPITLRHLLRPRSGKGTVAPEPAENILRTFGSGAMSFGAISAEAQRDIFRAMAEVGGRSNSGEGGENPYYDTEGVTASVKQVASGRFGVTAEYLIAGEEIQIKIAQGAKPGEGGQLMGVKVNADIARARHADEHVDLISPPPMHDIYSIEDLKQLIHELHQLKPSARVSVKLVSGAGIGTIAVGVAKAGADVIHVSGHDGGTGAAPLSAMKHAGLPWELGLAEVHRALAEQGIRDRVVLRVDGGLSTGRDVVIAAMLGAEEFDFGKLLLVAEGCIMARVCEKNTCPTGIATHDPRFKRLYRGSKDKVVELLRRLAEDVRSHLARIGVGRLADLTGRTDLLEIDPAHESFLRERGLNLGALLGPPVPVRFRERNPFIEPVSPLNGRILADVESLEPGTLTELAYRIRPGDRAALATLIGRLAQERRERRGGSLEPAVARARFRFQGSAGQGFGAFLPDGLEVRLVGEANDSVAKSMSGGRMVITPPEGISYDPTTATILGNCALYGATGGTLFALGTAGNRFAVRNSGATAVVEGVGMHACEYMTRGLVVVLGEAGLNVGAGMTGGTLYLRRGCEPQVNRDYLRAEELTEADQAALRILLEDYFRETGSPTARDLLADWERERAQFLRFAPLAGKRPGDRPLADVFVTVALPAAPVD